MIMELTESAKELWRSMIEFFKVVPYSENCLVFMFNGGSSSSKTIWPIDKKIGMESPLHNGMYSLHSPDGLTNWERNYILEQNCILEQNYIPKLHKKSTG